MLGAKAYRGFSVTGVYYYSITIFIALGNLGGVPLEIPPSRDKTISHGLDAVGGSIAFSVRFQAVLKNTTENATISPAASNTWLMVSQSSLSLPPLPSRVLGHIAA
jgi:hypothetical protein